MEAQEKKDRKRGAVRGERQLDLGEGVGNEAGALSWAAASQYWRCINVSARKFCQSLGHTVGILEVITGQRMFEMFA